MLLGELDVRLHKNTRQIDVYVELLPGTSIHTFLTFTRSHGLTPSNLQLQAENAGNNGLIAFTVTLKSPQRTSHVKAMNDLRTMEGVIYIEEL